MLPHMMMGVVLEELVEAAALLLHVVQGSHANGHHTSQGETGWLLQCWHEGVGCYDGTSYLHCPQYRIVVHSVAELQLQASICGFQDMEPF